jgi:hydroxymethylglutaryl-CoA reductase (NADPH)
MKQSLHTIDVGKTKDAMDKRKGVVEASLGISLQNIGSHTLDVETISSKNCENSIGAIQIPVGIAGPLLISFEDGSKEDVYIPLATTEGALVASTSRGCSIISKTPTGVVTSVIAKKMTRAPVFRCPSAVIALSVKKWVAEHLEMLKLEASKEERFCSLLAITGWCVGRSLFLRFSYDTSDAMGMNMVTFATQKLCGIISEQFPNIELLALSGNMCIDKKPSALGLIEGRGFSINAEAFIPNNLIQEKLHCSPDRLIEVATRKLFVGSSLAGAYGFNAHVANIVAAMFIATGQDPAHVVEGSQAITTVEKYDEKTLYIGVYCSSINCATVGGGTDGRTQQEALNILEVTNNLAPGENSKRLAQIIAGAVLAGELSLLGALTEGSLSKAHKNLGRS